MARPARSTLMPDIQKRIVDAMDNGMTEAELLAVVQRAANSGVKDAQAWLRREGYIHITRYPHRALFVRFDDHSERNSLQSRQWVKAVYRRDNFTCQKCGKVGGTLNAHHIKSWAEHPDSRYDLENGVTLCELCHSGFHPRLRLFGYDRTGKRETRRG